MVPPLLAGCMEVEVLGFEQLTIPVLRILDTRAPPKTEPVSSVSALSQASLFVWRVTVTWHSCFPRRGDDKMAISIFSYLFEDILKYLTIFRRI